MSSTIFVLLILPLLVGVDDCDAIPDDASYPSSLCVLEEEEEEEEEEEDANHRKHKEKKTVLFSVMKLLSRVVVFVVVCTKDFDAAL
jgi:hypothetical protein